MKRHTLKTFVLTCLVISATGLLDVQQSAAEPRAKDSARNDANQDWYYSSETPVETKSILQQKAEAKAQQRIARLETYRWLGYSPNRPPATAIPFTSSNSLEWKKAERNQYNWHTGYRPRTSAYRPYFWYY